MQEVTQNIAIYLKNGISNFGQENFKKILMKLSIIHTLIIIQYTQQFWSYWRITLGKIGSLQKKLKKKYFKKLY